MREQFAPKTHPIKKENRLEKVKEELKARPDVHEKIEKLGRELDDLFAKYINGEKTESIRDLISEKWFAMFDDYCILFSENQKALKISSDLDVKYRNAVRDVFGGNSPLALNQPFLSEVMKPLPSKFIHKVKKTETHLGHDDRTTGRSGEDCFKLLDLKGDELKGEKVLDVGAGEGNFVRDLKQKGVEISAIEANWGVTGQIPSDLEGVVIKANWNSIPFENDSFNRAMSVFAFPVWAQTWQEMEVVLKEMIRVVKTGGNINFVPAAPVLEKGDVDAKTRKNWEGPLYCDTIYRREFEEVLQKFVGQVEVTIGEPHADFAATSQIKYFPLKLKVIKKG